MISCTEDVLAAQYMKDAASVASTCDPALMERNYFTNTELELRQYLNFVPLRENCEFSSLKCAKMC